MTLSDFFHRFTNVVQQRFRQFTGQGESLEELYQQRHLLDSDNHAEYLLNEMDSSDTERAEMAAQTLLWIAGNNPQQIAPYMSELVSRLTSGDIPEMTSDIILAVAGALSEETFDNYRETLLEVVQGEYAERVQVNILIALIPDMHRHQDSIETTVQKAVELLESELEVESVFNGELDVELPNPDRDIPNTPIILYAISYLREVARHYPETLSAFTDQLLALQTHRDSRVQIKAFLMLARLSDHDSAPISGTEFSGSLSDTFASLQRPTPLLLIEAAEITIAATPDCWDELSDSLLPLLASDDERIRKKACKSLLSIVGQHPSLPSNPTQLHDRLSALATEFQLADTYGQQVEWSLDRLASHQTR